MPSRLTQFTVHPALGGLDISSDPSVLDPNFLVIADNIEYREGGQRKKRGGTLVYSTGSTESGTGTYMVSSSSNVRALADFWRYGTSLTPTQNLLAVTGASVFRSTGDGLWTPITTASSFGSNTNTQTNITLAGDYAVISDGQSLPLAYDQTTVFSTLSTKAFTKASYHLNRLFYTGYSSAPSEMTYTAAGNIFDSTGGDTGVVGIRQGDGDQIIGISEPFYGSLYIFKGPQFGSVHQFSGTTPATFATAQVAHGAPALNARAIISTPTDIYWMSNYGVHSLQTTVKFGNVEQAFLSLPIQKLWRDNLIKRGELADTWGFWNPTRSIVGWAVTPTGETSQHWLLVYNYALSDPKPGGKKFWSIWKITGYAIKSGTSILVPTGLPILQTHTGDPHLWFGGDNGQVYVGDIDNALGDANQAYTARIRTPTITRFRGASGHVDVPETSEKEFAGVVTYFVPKGPYSANLTVSIDRRQTVTTVPFTGGGAVLGAFIMGTDTLGGNEFNYHESPESQDRGRSIYLDWSQSGLKQDMEIFGYSIRYREAETVSREQA